jgi:hypothetical protein
MLEQRAHRVVRGRSAAVNQVAERILAVRHLRLARVGTRGEQR